MLMLTLAPRFVDLGMPLAHHPMASPKQRHFQRRAVERLGKVSWVTELFAFTETDTVFNYIVIDTITNSESMQVHVEFCFSLKQNKSQYACVKFQLAWSSACWRSIMTFSVVIVIVILILILRAQTGSAIPSQSYFAYVAWWCQAVPSISDPVKDLQWALQRF